MIINKLQLTEPFHSAPSDGHCSKLPNRTDYRLKDQHIRRQWRVACSRVLWRSHRPGCRVRSRQSNTSTRELVGERDVFVGKSFQLELEPLKVTKCNHKCVFKNSEQKLTERLINSPGLWWLHRLRIRKCVWSPSSPSGCLSSAYTLLLLLLLLLLVKGLRRLHIRVVDASGISILRHLYWWCSCNCCRGHLLLRIGELRVGWGREVVLFLRRLRLLIRLLCVLWAARLRHEGWSSHLLLLLLLLWCLGWCWLLLLQESILGTAHGQDVSCRCENKEIYLEYLEIEEIEF